WLHRYPPMRCGRGPTPDGCVDLEPVRKWYEPQRLRRSDGLRRATLIAGQRTSSDWRRIMPADVQPGLVGEAQIQVRPADLASALGSGTVDVYGTPAMIALLETAAINAVDHLLPEGSATVGTHLDVRHLAPS